MRYKVHIGYTRKGRYRWKFFDTIEEATALVSAVFQETKIVLAILKA